jgi:hypothetical protein
MSIRFQEYTSFPVFDFLEPFFNAYAHCCIFLSFFYWKESWWHDIRTRADFFVMGEIFPILRVAKGGVEEKNIANYT